MWRRRAAGICGRESKSGTNFSYETRKCRKITLVVANKSHTLAILRKEADPRPEALKDEISIQ